MIEGQQLPEGNCSPEHWDGNTLLVQRIVDIMFADEVDEPELVGLALAICEECPAIDECIGVGMSEQYGVWGGLRASERVVMRREQRKL